MTRSILSFAAALLLSIFACSAQQINEAVLSPDGSLLAMIIEVDFRNEIIVVEVATGKVNRVTDSEILEPRFCYKQDLRWVDASRIAYLSNHNGTLDMYLHTLSTGMYAPLLNESNHGGNLEYSTRNREFYYVTATTDSRAAAWRLPLGSQLPTRISERNEVFSKPLISPDGQTLALTAMPDVRLALIDLESGKKIQSKLPTANTQLLAWSPDGNRFIYAYGVVESYGPIKETVRLYDIRKRSHTVLFKLSEEEVTGALWSPCGTKYLYAVGGICFIDKDIDPDRVKQRDETAIEVIKENKAFPAEGSPVGWLPDARNVIMVVGREVYLLDTETGTKRTIY